MTPKGMYHAHEGQNEHYFCLEPTKSKWVIHFLNESTHHPLPSPTKHNLKKTILKYYEESKRKKEEGILKAKELLGN